MDLKVTGFVKNGRAMSDPTGGMFTAQIANRGYPYPTLPKANIGRIYGAALENVPKVNKRSKSGWADLARATGIEQPRLTIAGTKRSTSSMSSGISNRIFSMAMRGVLPKDKEQRDKLLNLAGEPWSSEPSLRLP